MNDILNEDGSIKNAKVLAAYNRICDTPVGFDRKSYTERVESAEAFLKLVCRMTPQQLEKWGYK